MSLLAIDPAAALVAVSLIFAEYLAEPFAYRETSRQLCAADASCSRTQAGVFNKAT